MTKFKEIKNRKVNIALIGCGRISINHLNAIFAHVNDFNLVAICDPIEDSKSRFISEFNLINDNLKNKVDHPKQYKSLDELIIDIKKSAIKVDLVVITTPSGLHAAQTIIAAKNNLHVCREANGCKMGRWPKYAKSMYRCKCKTFCSEAK